MTKESDSVAVGSLHTVSTQEVAVGRSSYVTNGTIFCQLLKGFDHILIRAVYPAQLLGDQVCNFKETFSGPSFLSGKAV